MSTDFELVPATSAPQGEFELVPFPAGVSANIPDPVAPAAPPAFDEFRKIIKDIQDSGEPGWATEGVPEMMEQSATSFERIMDEVDKSEHAKSNYMLQQMWNRSVTGSVIRQTFDAEINQEMEDQLGFTDKLLIAAGTMGPDMWLFGAGAAIPVASGAIKSLPLIARPLQAASSFGFFEGVRRVYMNNVLEKGDPGKLEFIDLLGSSLFEAIKGGAIGAALGAGQQFRHKIFNEASNAVTATAKAGGFLAGEAAAITALMTQMHNPGVLPTKEDFAIGMALIFGFEGLGMANGVLNRSVGDVRYQMRRLRNEVDYNLRKIDDLKTKEDLLWYEMRRRVSANKPGERWTPEQEARYEHTPAAKMINAYERHGVHPETLARRAETDITIKEDMANPMTDRIRALDIDGGMPPEPPKIVTEIKENFRNARLGINPTSELVVEPATGGAPAPATTAPAAPPVVLQTPGIAQPIQIYVGEPAEVLTLPSGQQVMVPLDRNRSLALSEDGLINSPMAIALAMEVAPGISIRAGSEGVDPVFKQYPGEVGGYFSKAENSRNDRIVGLERSVQAAGNTIRALRRQMRFDDVLLEQQRLDGMNAELARLKTSSLEAKESSIVINRLLQDTSPGRQIQTIVHEVGHLLSFLNEGWEQIDPVRSQQAGELVGRTVGNSSLFFNTLSGYPGIIRTIFEFAQQRGISYNDIKAEAQFLSRLWRLTPSTQHMQDPYRQSGSELIADVVSVSLHRPDIMQQYAPNLMQAMELFYEARPEVKARVGEMNDMIAKGRSWDYASHAIQQGFMRAEIGARKASDERAQKVQQSDSDLVTRIQSDYLDRYQVLWNKISDDSGRLNNTVQKLQFKTTIKSGYVREMATEVLKPLTEVGMTEGDIGELFFYRRILQDPARQKLFNALGFTEVEALEGFNRLTDLYGRDPRIFQAIDRFHEIRSNGPIRLLEKYALVGDDYLTYIKGNEAYVRFDDLGHYLEGLERGYGSSDRLQSGQVLTDVEGAKLKQIGSLGFVRNTVTATIERDLKLYDNILKTNAIKETITALINEGRVPIFRKSRFKDMAKHQPASLGEYVESDFTVMSYPQRRYNAKADKYYTARVEYMVPKIFADAFNAAPTAFQKLVGQVSNTSWSAILNNMLDKNSKWTPKDKALIPAFKAIQNANDFARAMMITFGGSFLVANFVSYDFLRTFVQMPRTNENIPFSGKSGLPIEYAKAFGDLFRWQFQGKMHDDIGRLIEEGLFVTGRRYTEDMDNATLLSQITQEYGALGYQAKIWQPGLAALGTLSESTIEAMRRVLTVMDTTAKLAAYRMVQDPRYSHLTVDQLELIVREQIGSPAYAVRGMTDAQLNMPFLFYSSIKNALRGDYRAFKRNPTMFFVEWGTLVIPTVLMSLAYHGFFEGAWDAVFGDEEEDGFITESLRKLGIDPTRFTSTGPSAILRTRTQMERQGNWIIPFGMNEKGEGSVHTFPLPQGAVFFFMHNTTMTVIEAAYKAFSEDNTDKEAREILRGYGRLAIDTMMDTYNTMRKTQERTVPGLAPWVSAPFRAANILTEGNTASNRHHGKQFAQDIPEGERLAAAAKTFLKDFGVSKNLVNMFEEDGLLESLQNLFNPPPGSTDSLMARSGEVAANLPILGDGVNRLFRSGNPGLTERVYRREEEHRADMAMAQGLAARLMSGEKLTPNQQRIVTENISEQILTRDMLINAARKAGVDAMDNDYLRLLIAKGKYAEPDVTEAAKRGVKDAQIAIGLYMSTRKEMPVYQEVKK